MRAPGGDPSREYTPEEERQLADNLRRVTALVYAHEFAAAPAGEPLLCELHRELFDGVRAHAGRHRAEDFGSERLTFGPNRSAHRGTVPAELLRIFRHVRAAVQSFDANPDDPSFEASALHLAAWMQAELIGVHPFEDGNGRSTRLLTDWLLIRLGLRPIPIEAVKDEYNACLNTYFRTRDLAPLVDLLIGLYPFDDLP